MLQVSSLGGRAASERGNDAFAGVSDTMSLMQVVLGEASKFGVQHIIACLFVRGDDGAVTIRPLAENSPLDYTTAKLVQRPDFIPMMLDIYGAGTHFTPRTAPMSPYRHVFDAIWDSYRNATGCHDYIAVPVVHSGLLRGYVSYVFPMSAPPDAARRLSDLAFGAYRRLLELGLAEAAESPLTARQCEALGLCAAGKRDAEIAEQLGISTATAHEHIEQAKRRLNVRTRVQAAVIAARNGWI